MKRHAAIVRIMLLALAWGIAQCVPASAQQAVHQHIAEGEERVDRTRMDAEQDLLESIEHSGADR